MPAFGWSDAISRGALGALLASAVFLVAGPRLLSATADAPEGTPLDRAVATVTANDLESALTFLASDALQGRATGTSK